LTSTGAGHPPATAGLVNLANGLTVLRLVMVPVFVACLAAGSGGSQAASWRFAAFAVFAVASVTDLLDGELARRRGLITDFGKIADPIADKALTGSALITLSALGDLSWWVTWIILAREVGITVLRFMVIRHGVIPASRGGKVKTVIQMVAVGLYILPLQIGWVRPAMMAMAVSITVLTGADYVARALRLRRPAQPGAGAQGDTEAPGTDVAGTATPAGPSVSAPGDTGHVE
jgi:CDP-diacylglycerol--glycerol-3-phosphate 3-phosphatidyltransferase